MSSSNRTTSKGGKGAKADKSHKSDKSESGNSLSKTFFSVLMWIILGKGSGEKQQHRDANSKGEDPSIKDKVKQLIEMSHRSEEEVCLALHECDNDINLASNMLFENMSTVSILLPITDIFYFFTHYLIFFFCITLIIKNFYYELLQRLTYLLSILLSILY